MTVEQDQLVGSGTGIKFETINNDRADRLLHNGVDILKGRFQYFEITEASRGFVTNSGTTNPREYLEGSYLVDSSYAGPAQNAITYFYRLKFSKPVTINKVKIYSAQEIVSASLNAITLATNAASISITSRSSSFRSDLSPAQYEHILNFSNTSLQELRIGLASPIEAWNIVSQIIVGEDYPRSNVIYYGTNGVQKSSYSAQHNQLFDICYNSVNGHYYTVRYKETDNITMNPDDDFSTPSGLSTFNALRWTEDIVDSAFFRSVTNNNVVFSTTSGTGALLSTATFTDLCSLELGFNITTLTGSASFLSLNAVESDTENLIYGVGITARSGDGYFKACIKNYTDSTGGSFSLRRLAPTLATVYSGAETWTITYTGSSGSTKLFSIAGSVNGSQTSASGANYIINYSNSYINFDILASESVALSQSISFTVDYETVLRGVTSGTVSLERSAGNNFTSSVSAAFNEVIVNTHTAKAKIFATNNNATMSVTADSFDRLSGSYIFSNYPVLTVERVSDQAQVVSGIIESFDVLPISGVSAYNQVPYGAIQIAVNPSDLVFLKVYDVIYSFSGASNFTGYTTPPTAGINTSATGVIPSFGVSSFQYHDETGGFLGYVDFDSFLGEVTLKTLNDTDPAAPLSRKVFLDIIDYNETKTTDGVPYQFYLHGSDSTALFYIRKNGSAELNSIITSGTAGAVTSGSIAFTDSSKNFNTLLVKKGDLLNITTAGANQGSYIITNVPSATTLNVAGPVSSNQVTNTPVTNKTFTTTQSSLTYRIMSNGELLQFNIDPDVTAFTAVNTDDFNLQAGTGEIANITAEVINSWGEPLSGKTATFLVIQGDGVVNPPSTTTNASGIATTQFTVGNTAGAIQVQVTISD